MSALEFSYPAELVRVIDGDTIIVKCDLGFNIKRTITCRLSDIDAPEVRGEEKDEGLRVKRYAENLIGDEQLIVTTKKKGKFGRWLATIWTADDTKKSLNQKIYDFYSEIAEEEFDDDPDDPDQG